MYVFHWLGLSHFSLLFRGVLKRSSYGKRSPTGPILKHINYPKFRRVIVNVEIIKNYFTFSFILWCDF